MTTEAIVEEFFLVGREEGTNHKRAVGKKRGGEGVKRDESANFFRLLSC